MVVKRIDDPQKKLQILNNKKIRYCKSRGDNQETTTYSITERATTITTRQVPRPMSNIGIGYPMSTGRRSSRYQRIQSVALISSGTRGYLYKRWC